MKKLLLCLLLINSYSFAAKAPKINFKPCLKNPYGRSCKKILNTIADNTCGPIILDKNIFVYSCTESNNIKSDEIHGILVFDKELNNDVFESMQKVTVSDKCTITKAEFSKEEYEQNLEHTLSCREKVIDIYMEAIIRLTK